MATVTALREEQARLRQLKADRWKQAQASGIITDACLVSRWLGQHLVAERYGPKYAWEQDGIYVYCDHYGNYLNVHVGAPGKGGRQVLSSHFCDQLYVPGEWEAVIRQAVPAARERYEQDELARETEAVRRLRQEMGLERE